MILGKPEKVVLFLSSLQFQIRMHATTAIYKLRIGLFQFAPHTIPDSVMFLVDISGRETALPEFLRGRDMVRVGGPDDINSWKKAERLP